MSKPDFAIYAIALGIQGMIAILTDVGFGSAIAGLVGTRYKDKAVLGSYIRTASHIRQVLLMIVAGAAVYWSSYFAISKLNRMAAKT